MSELRLHLLGPPLIELDGQPIQLGRHKATALLAYLAVTRRNHTRDALATLLWPDLDQSAARAELRRTLSLLHRALGSEWFVADRETVDWAPEAQLSLDVDEFRQCLAACAAHGHAPQDACAECLPLLTQAAELYRDGFLAGFTLPDAPAFDEWQFFEAEGLRDALAGALQRLAHWHGGRGEHEAAIGYARRWLALDPVHEPAHRHLMELYAGSGQRSAALRQYAECERVLKEELGATPEQETQALYERIRSGLVGPSGAPKPTKAGPQAPAPIPPDNLPAWLAPFIGRQRELREIDVRLRDPTCRLLTLVGPGGIGKTRLAVEAARQRVSDFPDGAFFVPLAGVGTAEGIAPAVAAAIGFAFYGPAEPAQQLAAYLRRRQVLLVLDNMEHLIEQAGALAGILGSAPGVKALVTSRAQLAVQGEHLFAVEGMAYPILAREKTESVWETESVSSYSAMELFLDCARRVRPEHEWNAEDLAQIGDICRLVEGSPLAILLAASWVEVLTPGEIAAQVRRGLDILAADMADLPERQCSMRAAFDVSWRLLTDREQQVFSALSVFRGGFTAEAAQAVAGADLRTLRALAHKSLVASTTDRAGLGDRRGLYARYSVHELLRQYGAARLAEMSGALEETGDRHCAYYADLLQRHHEQIWRRNLEEVRPEIDNCRAAWVWAAKQADAQHLAQMTWDLVIYYTQRSLLQEPEMILRLAAEQLSAVVGKAPPSGAPSQSYLLAMHTLAILLMERGSLNVHMGRLDVADRLFAQSQALLERPELADHDLRVHQAWLSLRMGERVLDTDPRASSLLIERCLVLSRDLGSVEMMEVSLLYLGVVAYLESDYRQARRWFEELATLGGEPSAYSGLVAAAQGDVTTAERVAARVYGPSWDQDVPGREWLDLWELGQLLAAVGRYPAAQRALEEMAVQCRETGNDAHLTRCLSWLGWVNTHLGRYEQARMLAEEERSLAGQKGAQYMAVAGVLKLGELALVEGKHLEARQLLDEVIALNQTGGTREQWAMAVAAMGHVARRLGESEHAWEGMCQALQVAVELGSFESQAYALSLVVLLLADQGEGERAVELWALLSRYPMVAHSRWYEDIAGRELAAVAARLPAELREAAQARGRARDLEATLVELLEELG